MAKKPKIDREAIEREFRAGQMSIRAIAEAHGITEGAIRKMAKSANPPWVRNLASQVRTRVSSELVRDEVRGDRTRVPDEEAIAVAAARGVEVVRSHRQQLARLRAQAERLAVMLERELDLMDAVAAGKEPPEGVATIAAVLGPKESVSDVLNKVSNALDRIITAERQAFQLDEPAGDTSATRLTPEQIKRMAAEVAEGA